MKIAWRVFVLISLTIFCFFLYYYRVRINDLVISGKVNVQDLSSSLINISAIVFGVCGAWVALVFPKALEKLTDSDGKIKEISSNDEIVAFKDISISSAISLIVVVLLLMTNYAGSIVSLFESKNDLLKYSFYLVSILYFIQIYILLITIKTTMKVFSSYGMSLINRDASRNLESQKKSDDW